MRDFFLRRIFGPIISELSKGADPGKLSLAATLGALVGIIPILGISTGLGFLVAGALRLNHVVFQAINYLVYPIQLILFPVFLKLGGLMLGGEVMDFDLSLLKQEFLVSIPMFLSKYGVIGGKAVIVWAVFSVVTGLPLHLILNSLFVRIHRNWRDTP